MSKNSYPNPHFESGSDINRMQKPVRLLWLLSAGLILLIAVSAVFFFGNAGTQDIAMFPTCQTNLRVIGCACEAYSVDNDLYYPASLDTLVKTGYIKELPSCYASADRTILDRIYYRYQRKFLSKPQMTYALKSYGQYGVIIYCSGRHHSEVIGENDGPAYGTRSGVVRTLNEAQYK